MAASNAQAAAAAAAAVSQAATTAEAARIADRATAWNLSAEAFVLGFSALLACCMCFAILLWIGKDFLLKHEAMRERADLQREAMRMSARVQESRRHLAPGLVVPRQGPLATLHALGKLGACSRGARLDDDTSDRAALLGIEPTQLKPFGDCFTIDLDEIDKAGR